MTQPPGSPAAAIKLAYRPAATRGQAPMRPMPPERWNWLAAVLVIALPIAALWPLCAHGFTSWDDNSTVKDNPTLNPVTWHSLHTWWCTSKMDLYVPVTYSAWGIIAAFARTPPTATTPGYLNPIAFHTANLVLHVMCCLVVFALLRLLVGRAWPAAAGALLFGLHPVQVEAVGWASGLKDVLSGLLALSAIWQYLVAVKKSEAKEPRRLGWGWNYGLATGCFILAMLAKPNALMAPVLAGILDGMVVRQSWRRAILWLWPWLVLSVAWMVVAKFVQPAPNRPLNVAVIERPLVAIASVGFYVRKLIWPTNFAVDYGLRPAVLAQSPWLMADGVVLASGAALLWFARKSAGPMVAGAVFFVAALLPVMGFVTFDFQDYSNVADHYLYVPMVGIALMAAWVAARWRGPGVVIGSAAVLGMLGTLSYFQTQFWLDTETLFVHAMDVNPDSAAAYHSLALLEIDRAEHAPSLLEAHQDAQTALQLAQKSIDLRPASDLGYIAKGMALYHLRRKDEAAQQYIKALTLDPESEAALEDLAGVLAETQHYAQAEKLQIEVVRRNPTSAQDHSDLGVILGDEGKYPQAIAELTIAIRLDPFVPKYHNALAYALAKSGQIPAAIRQYDISLRLDPPNENAQRGRRYWLGVLHR
ncbi:MAG TPA: tetratricopeptide repeat protein [Tepidisphaeraceae bacterium]|nr:tetratricopeptide repeat protein [Tepidisphaeraceae bacterium]